MDDGDQKTTKISRQKRTFNLLQGLLTDVSYVLPAVWLRRPIQVNYGPNWILLGRGRRFLFYLRSVFIIVYFLIQTFK
jgi:hypothetical protein